jgi:hypothetical protein
MTASAPARSLIIGVHCTHGHFNDPRIPYCSVCGISMIQRTRVPVPGLRPPLGVLTLDDGTARPVERGWVLGRQPEGDQLVRSGRADPLALADPKVSRIHARMLPHGWDLILTDAGSTNGTWVCPPGRGRWSAVPVGAGLRLAPGSRVAIGAHEIRYDSYRNP